MKLKIFVFLAIIICSNNFLNAEETNKEISFYTGTFDIIDKEGDDQTTLFGIEHKNPDLFRDTFLGKFKPVSGGFMTGDNSIYLYNFANIHNYFMSFGIKGFHFKRFQNMRFILCTYFFP